MGKGKLAKFADMEQYENVFQCPYSAVSSEIKTAADGRQDAAGGHSGGDGGQDAAGGLGGWSYRLQGRWREEYFGNGNPIVLELGCGKGEYAVELARRYPEKNFIGVDIKGARMWTGATQALSEGLRNVAFLRTNIEIIDRFFAADEVQEIWLTFSDPQMKNPRKRLTSTYFMERYRRFLTDGGLIHLKTDSNFLFSYTTLMAAENGLSVDFCTEDLYHDPTSAQNVEAATLGVQTYYEQMWMARGLNIRYMRWHLPHSTPLREPDVEIELDDYRSYHRTKRSPRQKAK